MKGIDLTFNQGELTAMIGPSGCGKSTYLRCLNRMNDLIPDVTITGSVVYKGKDIYGPKTDNVELRKEIGMVFQQPNPFPFSVYENVIYGLRLKGVKDKQVLDEAVETSLKVPPFGRMSKINFTKVHFHFLVDNNSGFVSLVF